MNTSFEVRKTKVTKGVSFDLSKLSLFIKRITPFSLKRDHQGWDTGVT